ncbi:MAG: hypothetical protein ACR2HJ_01055 [Fimbriimonadales bacterium]
MKLFSICTVSAVGACAIGLVYAPPKESDTMLPTAPAKVVLAGVTWESSLAESLVRANRENKPVLHLQMFGRLDDALC